MTLEIETNRGISAQILRHRSFTFQEFSQRYADSSMLADEIPMFDLRSQDTKNRQNSIDDVDPFLKQELEITIQRHFQSGMDIYKQMIEKGIAKECARFVLPLATPTRLYMAGSCRSWITYIALREKNGTQKEHMDIAKECKKIFAKQFPICAEALGGVENQWVLHSEKNMERKKSIWILLKNVKKSLSSNFLSVQKHLGG
jgi:thymidylate synthase (FAD)